MTPEIFNRIDRLTIITYNRISKEIDAALGECCNIISGSRIGIAFDPLTNKKTSRLIRSQFEFMHSKIKALLEESIRKSWEFANLNYDEITKRYLLNKKIKAGLRDIYFNHNSKALKAFLERKMNGLSLSDRVWNITLLSEQELGLLVEEGLAVGKSAAELSRDVRYILKEPETRFRRVRNKDGKLVPSKAMKNFHPGKGIYRSAYKNSLRLTGQENNMSYHTSEHHRQQQIDFIVGKEVKLSSNHPEFDFCDHMKGSYPKEFLFRKWHTKCRCYTVPLLMDSDKFDDYIITGDMPNVSRVETIPANAINYLNSKPFENWKKDPYFVADNADLWGDYGVKF